MARPCETGKIFRRVEVGGDFDVDESDRKPPYGSPNGPLPRFEGPAKVVEQASMVCPLKDRGTVSAGGKHVLSGGFWGLSRHINYLGEILMACALALSLGHPLEPGPWLYPLYYLVLLLPRQAADDRRCAEKYGPLWVEYCKRVPWRIVPRIY